MDNKEQLFWILFSVFVWLLVGHWFGAFQ